MLRHSSLTISLLSLVVLGFCLASPARAEQEGVHISVTADQDGDEVILVESEWISMHLLPRMQAIINRFVFRPTGNDIVEALSPKIRKLGGGILMDCLWEQDWRFQELKEKPYPFRITKTGPEEAQVVFETDIVGWVGSDNSGVISKLLSDLVLRRTVTLKSGQPFFRFDFEFINKGEYAKRPTFWPHNSSVIDVDGLETVARPTARQISEYTAHFREITAAPREDFLHDYNHGWSARMSSQRREGIVYLMDYDYLNFIYNNGNATCEWTYDSILAFKDKPWHGRVYILPVIGLSHIDYANEYFICDLDIKREDGVLSLDYYLTSSYEHVAQVTLNAEVEYDLLADEQQRQRLPSVTIDGIGIQPVRGHVEVPLAATDPLIFDITAFAELPEGTVKKFDFQNFYVGEYGLGRNIRREGTPVKLLHRPIPRPEVPELPPGLSIDRVNFRVFGVFGLGTHRTGVRGAIMAMAGVTLDEGFCTGRDSYGYGLSDFPYDYSRLYSYRVLVFSNLQDREFRRIGASILLPWLEAGGGLVISGGENSFTFELREHEINQYYPIATTDRCLRRGPLQLQPPRVPEHPIFAGIDLAELPYLYYYHDIQVKTEAPARVLMQIGDKPFIVEQQVGKQLTMVVAANGFGDPAEFDNHPHLRHWSQWPKLFGNIVRYAGAAR